MNEHQIEERFISTVVLGEFAQEAYSRIQEKWLMSVEDRQAWAIIRSHYARHHATITEEEFYERMPGYSFREPAESIDGLVETLHDRYIRLSVDSVLDDFDPDDEDPVASLNALGGQIRALQAEVDRGTGEDLAKTAGKARERYAERKKNKGAVGLEWPWLPLQESTLGAQKGTYNIFYARPKNMKSWLVIYLLAKWFERYGKKILIINRELSKEQFQDRLVAMFAGIPYGDFKRASLTDQEYDDFVAATEWLEEQENIIIESIYSAGAEAAGEVDALCEKYGMGEEDILIVDGMYFYAGSSDWQLMRDFSQGIQRTTKRRGLVTVCTTQGNRTQGKSGADAGEELGLGDGPAQDADMLVRVALDEDSKEITLSIRAIREGMPVSFVINALLCSDFSVKYTNDYFADSEGDGDKPSKRRRLKSGKPKGTLPPAPTAKNVARPKKRRSVSPRKAA